MFYSFFGDKFIAWQMIWRKDQILTHQYLTLLIMCIFIKYNNIQ